MDRAAGERRRGAACREAGGFPANPRRTSGILPFLPTGGGWPTLPMSRGPSKFTFEPFRTKGGKWQISNSGGAYPMWSRNGHELFFRDFG